MAETLHLAFVSLAPQTSPDAYNTQRFPPSPHLLPVALSPRLPLGHSPPRLLRFAQSRRLNRPHDPNDRVTVRPPRLQPDRRQVSSHCAETFRREVRRRTATYASQFQCTR